MRYLLLTDIHANRHALEAVLEAAPPSSYDRLIVLGDLVGYGADPNGVIERVRALDPVAVIRGNHDKAACGIDSAEDFNTAARIAAIWTMRAVTPGNRDYLAGLPAGPLQVEDGFAICHGAPFDEDAYVFDAADANEAFAALPSPICFYGHTHLPAIFARTPHGLTVAVPDGSDAMAVTLAPGAQYLVNPGSVGQPRDGDPRAAFALYDAEAREVILRRVPYPVELAQEAILAAGLPGGLAARLGLGR
jgi:diadenosine tetraphosphatase ApaH/serine/threonine PP2A family protein phosphatase